jgi:hypothetical protein
MDIQTLLNLLALISIPIGVFYHIMTLNNTRRNQELTLKAQNHALETRQAQLFMNIYNQSYSNPQFQTARATLMKYQWNTFEDFKKLYHLGENADPEFISAYDLMGSLFEGMGVLVRESFLDVRFVALLMTGNIRTFWEKTMPIIGELRVDQDWPRLLIETEFLYNELMKYNKEHPELAT